TELSVAQRPLTLEQREHRVQHLTRHVIGNQQAERQGKDDPGILARNADSAGVVIVSGDWVKGHAASSRALFYFCYQACNGRADERSRPLVPPLGQPRCGTPLCPALRLGAMPLASRVSSMVSYCTP